MRQLTLLSRLSRLSRRLAALGAALTLGWGLAGCSSLPAQQPQQERDRLTSNLNGAFTSTMEISYQGVEATASLDQRYPGNYLVRFSAPASLEGMEIETEGENLTIRYRDLSAQFTADELFDSAVAKTAVSTLNRVTSQEGLDFSLEGQCLSLEGTGGTGRFLLKIDRENGNLLEMDFPDQQLHLSFRDFLFLS